ncbi:cellobiose transport system permease protein [Allocatelliglobosispora scoriae]|uniref:Cellobiose transport system permease protein n=1 Tax=Allocatelliglobosispora scoriae TaxID=643052 RepID=A0A841BY15_9ACTN|nr:sugar ABC transporter permease [Allocatelliglobosispora scoriae]MBB5872555.1 cellobiose transport system permease protein [Allocatelliglobosispora scoriae]
MKSWLHRLDVKASPYLYISPFFILFAILGIFPLLYTAWVSLHDWSLISDTHTFIGIQNYKDLLADSFFWNALWNTLSIWVISTVPQLIFALILAHVLNNRLRGQSLWRAGLILPNITSVVAVTIIFGQLFGRDYGLINWVLGIVGVGHIDWQSGTASSHIAISVMIIWRWTGYNALIYLAAMQAVPESLHEAAIIDGATSMQRLRKITIPSIRPTIIFTVIISSIGGMQVLAEPLLFGGGLTGGSDRQFQTLSLYLYEIGFSRFDFGYASATAWLMFLVITFVAAANFFIIRRIRRA